MTAAVADVGIGLRAAHHEALLRERPALGFVEVHSENFFADGGAAIAVLREVRDRYEVSLHGVGLGLGSAAGIDAWHLDRLARLVDRIDPVRVSDHACFARVALPGGAVVHAADLLPVALNETTLEIMASNIAQVQDRLGRPLLVENLAHTLAFEDNGFTGPAFLAELCRRSGCGLLLDLNNLIVAALNRGDGASPDDALAAGLAQLEALPQDCVGEMHLAGYRDGAALAIDDHGSRVRPAVWTLYAAAVRRFGAVPTLVEWDTDLPPLQVLLDEAAHAAAVQRAVP